MVTSLGLHFGKSREDVLVGKKGDWRSCIKKVYFGKDVLFAERAKQSEKPKILHELIEKNFHEDAALIELFARQHNLRPRWTQLGDELNHNTIKGWMHKAKLTK